MTIDYDEVLRDIGELGTKSHPLPDLCVAVIFKHKSREISIEIEHLCLLSSRLLQGVQVRGENWD